MLKLRSKEKESIANLDLRHARYDLDAQQMLKWQQRMGCR